jgi:hypothetical protein
MFNLLKKRKIQRQDIYHLIFSVSAHEWIIENRFIKASITDFLDQFNEDILYRCFVLKSTLITKASGAYALSINQSIHDTIICFPEVVNSLASMNPSDGQAVLAHELGHIYHEHSGKRISPIQAQIEADKFAMENGFYEQLENFLLAQPESTEKRIRITYMTSFYFCNNN